MDATHTIHDYGHSDVHYEAHLPERRAEDAARPGEEPVDLLPARGVLVCLVIGAGLWALILAVGWLILR